MIICILEWWDLWPIPDAKWSGILSLILFCVYIDELLRRIDSSGLGCHIGHLSYDGVGYADDVGLLAPSIQALQKLLSVCEDFARDYNVLCNANKTRCMRVGSNGEPHTRVVTLNGATVMWKQRINHLGNIITSDLSDIYNVVLNIRKACLYPMWIVWTTNCQWCLPM